MNDRILFVLNSEWTRVRRTGLSELSRIPAAINELNRTRGKMTHWTDAWLVVPVYAGQQEQIPDEQASRIIPILTQISPAIKKQERSSRIEGELPSDPVPWREFARDALSKICQLTRRTGCFADILAVDWAMAPILDIAPLGFRTCFTTDLPPYDAQSLDLWREGIACADTVHTPTASWTIRLREAYPYLDEPLAVKAIALKFGTLIKRSETLPGQDEREFVIDDKVNYKNQLNDELSQTSSAMFVTTADMLFVVRNRWTHDDQKNYGAIVELLPKLIDWCSEKRWKPRFLIGPLGSPDCPSAKALSDALKAMAHEYSEFICIELGSETKMQEWVFLLKAADAQLIPSRYEPCGINHCQGMAYGVIPVCSTAGAMGESPMSAENSFQHVWDDNDLVTSSSLFLQAMMNACRCFYEEPDRWRKMQEHAMEMALQYDWKYLAPEYSRLFPGKEPSP